MNRIPLPNPARDRLPHSAAVKQDERGHSPDLMPTPERMRRGVELIEQQVVNRNGEQVVEGLTDDDGVAIRAYRSIDILAAMERRGAITAEMRQAGEEFQALFRAAHLDPLKAADHSRPFVSGSLRSEMSYRVQGARESVWRTVLMLGGFGSPGASCVWHVLGWGMSLKEWATEQGWRGKRVSTDAAPMVLITALGVLAGEGSNESS